MLTGLTRGAAGRVVCCYKFAQVTERTRRQTETRRIRALRTLVTRGVGDNALVRTGSTRCALTLARGTLERAGQTRQATRLARAWGVATDRAIEARGFTAIAGVATSLTCHTRR